jgi:hypothetical protein
MKRLRLGVMVLVMIGGATATAWAAQSSSASYQVNEVQFGSGSQLNASSANYQAQQNLGSTAGDTASSAHYGAAAGYLTASDPFLEMVVNPATIDLGTLSSVSTATGTATFHIRAYVDSGYEVVSMNNPPTNEDGAALHSLSTPTASSAGTEQFGINMVQNQTSCATPAPANFGADPVQVPTSAYANGQAASGYNTCGLFKYVKGDMVAQSGSRGWGETDYTISYIVNINGSSKAGRYTLTQDLVAVATY